MGRIMPGTEPADYNKYLRHVFASEMKNIQKNIWRCEHIPKYTRKSSMFSWPRNLSELPKPDLPVYVDGRGYSDCSQDTEVFVIKAERERISMVSNDNSSEEIGDYLESAFPEEDSLQSSSSEESLSKDTEDVKAEYESSVLELDGVREGDNPLSDCESISDIDSAFDMCEPEMASDFLAQAILGEMRTFLKRNPFDTSRNTMSATFPFVINDVKEKLVKVLDNIKYVEDTTVLEDHAMEVKIIEPILDWHDMNPSIAAANIFPKCVIEQASARMSAIFEVRR